MNMEKIICSADEMKAFSKDFLNDLVKSISSSTSFDKTKATMISLYGDLGAGKTTFVQGIAKSLGIEKRVISPTFVIERRYEIDQINNPHLPWKKLIHIDAYRINDSKEMGTLDWEENLTDPNNLIIIEWPERVADILPKNSFKIEFVHKGEDNREIKVII